MVAITQETSEAFPLGLRDVIPVEIHAHATDAHDAMLRVEPHLAAAGLGHVVPFNNIYRELTGRVVETIGLDSSDPRAFRYPDVVDRTVGIFADYYFKQLRAYTGLTDEKIDPAWQYLLYPDGADYGESEIRPHAERAESKETPKGIQFLLGMNAHINYDLAQALRDSKVEETYYQDYRRVIGMLIGITARELASAYVPGPEWSRWAAVRTTVATIAHWREKAWRSGKRLMGAEDVLASQGIMDCLDRNSVRTGRRIATLGSAALTGISRLPSRE